jgi:hypothetical protein
MSLTFTRVGKLTIAPENRGVNAAIPAMRSSGENTTLWGATNLYEFRRFEEGKTVQILPIRENRLQPPVRPLVYATR